ncbi:5-deoxy-glucuronate isomerase [Flavobacteriaceae bacterium TP-CH-4]|uniref:5-deoxy-glucuronate isomerase n=1 Tax=Pelagihabitans pacificus TaxID=2696054 RepID=A0A967EE75_9FLAO|nr:5-deoxy-glucuronate isomerase [Pelagihabitans pacificus]NHF60093.1 5-deoxy-glucuronate isomerase [Pelagihabitans pacificus]
MKNELDWKYESPEEAGFHTVVSPENSPCTVTWAFRLNLDKDASYDLEHELLELNTVLVSGHCVLNAGDYSHRLNPRDSFYLPAKQKVRITAKEDSIFFLGGGPYLGKGAFFVRPYDGTLPLGDIRQVHGQSTYKRDVFMTLAQQDKASSLICGITEGADGRWTSWPPHQHSKDLEEIYFYFDIPKPKFALHLASRVPGEIEAVFPVSTGDCVIIPEGYHPTVGMPGVNSCYFWIMSALRPESRRYDLAINDPNFE